MAVKKKNIYKGIEYENLKKELNGIVGFVEQLDCNNIVDDIDDEGAIPRIIARIEDKIKVTLSTIKEAISILAIIVEEEGNNKYVEDKVFIIKNCLSDIQYHFSEKPIDKLEHRELNYISIKGVPSKLLIRSTYQQVTDRTIITKKILEILPFIDLVGDKTTEAVEVRGNSETPYWKLRQLRKNEKN